MRSIPAVTTRPRECRTAASPAASSHSLRITPPCTFPAVLASITPIQRVSIEADSEGLRGSTPRGYTQYTPTSWPQAVGVAGRTRRDARPRRAHGPPREPHEEVPMTTAEKTQQCPVCKRPVSTHHTTVRVHGITFHAYCAGYKRKAAA